MDEDLKEKLLQSERVFNGVLLKVNRDIVVLPNGKEATREWIEHPGAVAVVPFSEDGRIAMVRQFRYPTGKVMLEVPAGKLDLNEKAEECVLRELKEETGYTARKIRRLTSIATTPGFSNEVIHLYIAEDLVQGAQCPDEDEFIHVVKYSKTEIKKMIQDGTIDDAKSILALMLAGI